MKKITTLLVAALLATGLLTACAQPAQQEASDDTLVVAMELAYPPFETKDEAGNPTGISVDLAKAFGEYAGYDVQIENVS